MMKVALFIPWIPDENTVPVLGPLYLIACMEAEGIDAWLFDERLDPAAVGKLIDFRPDAVGFSAVTPGYLRSLDIARKVKGALPSCVVVFGGPHPSAMPESTVMEPEVDYVLTGESERTFIDLLKRIREKACDRASLGEVRNLVFKAGEETVVTGPAPHLTSDELETLPWPAFHKMDIEGYFQGDQTHGIYKKGSRILPVMSTRGCPYSCTFCCRVLGKEMRSRSIGQVMDEIRFMIKTYKVDEIYFEDDNFTILRDRALEILDRMMEFRPEVHFRFANGVRADVIDEEILRAMKKAGVYSLSFGIESGSKSTLKKMKKGLKLEKAKENILLAKSLGFLVGTNCIIGYPGETPEDIEESLNFFMSLPLDSMAIVNLVPFPGTPVREVCEREGYLTEEAENWSNYYFSINNPIPLIETPYLSKRQIVDIVRKAYRKMYLRPSWILRAVRRMSLSQIAHGAALLLNPKTHDPAKINNT